MNELQIKAFENLIVESCNKTPIPNRVKYYVLREVAEKCLQVSETDVMLAMQSIPQTTEESEGKENAD